MKILREVVFYLVAAAVIIPTPILLLAWMTYQTWREVIYR